jgi:hypothetical protein
MDIFDIGSGSLCKIKNIKEVKYLKENKKYKTDYIKNYKKDLKNNILIHCRYLSIMYRNVLNDDYYLKFKIKDYCKFYNEMEERITIDDIYEKEGEIRIVFNMKNNILMKKGYFYNRKYYINQIQYKKY